MLNKTHPRIIDISQPVSSKSACFPGDVPFSKQITVSHSGSGVINLTALTMSPHVGTHTDSPVHVRGDLADEQETAGLMPLEPFIGEVYVCDVAPCEEEITLERVAAMLPSTVPPRILFRTCDKIRYETFEENYAFFSTSLVEYLSDRGVVLMGIDTPSVDHTSSKQLSVHHELLKRKMYWLENLDLTRVKSGMYELVALPIKFMELEASPVRAILLDHGEEG